MKLRVRQEQIYKLMREQGIETVAQLARKSGLDERGIHQMFIRDTFSKETLYLISDALGCTMNELVEPDWTHERKSNITKAQKC